MVILYVDMKTQKWSLIVGISMLKNWIEVYWIIRRVKYSLFYWLIKEDWILGCLWCGIERLCGVDFLRKGDFGLENFLWDSCETTLSLLAIFDQIRQQNHPGLNIMSIIEKILYVPQNCYILILAKINVM